MNRFELSLSQLYWLKIIIIVGNKKASTSFRSGTGGR